MSNLIAAEQFSASVLADILYVSSFPRGGCTMNVSGVSEVIISCKGVNPGVRFFLRSIEGIGILLYVTCSAKITAVGWMFRYMQCSTCSTSPRWDSLSSHNTKMVLEWPGSVHLSPHAGRETETEIIISQFVVMFTSSHDRKVTHSQPVLLTGSNSLALHDLLVCMSDWQEAGPDAATQIHF